jgi:hypothetical protein
MQKKKKEEEEENNSLKKTYMIIQHGFKICLKLTKKNHIIKIKYEAPNQKTINLKQPICSYNMNSKLVF